ncbi:MAG TPA: hypothetical protein VFX28_10235, partial [Methylomirabilota bacterium]|nr:hypothetical protein [Methylomirabilota bacterium]
MRRALGLAVLWAGLTGATPLPLAPPPPDRARPHSSDADGMGSHAPTQGSVRGGTMKATGLSAAGSAAGTSGGAGISSGTG